MLSRHHLFEHLWDKLSQNQQTTTGVSKNNRPHWLKFCCSYEQNRVTFDARYVFLQNGAAPDAGPLPKKSALEAELARSATKDRTAFENPMYERTARATANGKTPVGGADGDKTPPAYQTLPPGTEAPEKK